MLLIFLIFLVPKILQSYLKAYIILKFLNAKFSYIYYLKILKITLNLTYERLYTQQNLNSYFKKKNTCFKQKIA